MSFLAWLAVATIFLILEMASVTFLYACFTVGAVLAGVSTYLTDSVVLQTLVFLVVTAVLIPISRPLRRKMLGQGSSAERG